MKKNLLPFLMTGLLIAAGSNAWAQIVMLVQEPANLAGSYDFTYSSDNDWGADMDTVAITAEAAFAYDGSATEDSLACEAIVNRSEIEGKIAVLYRGECNFSLKALNVQDSGAVACVIINNVPGGPVGMGAGSFSAGVTIPVVMISDLDGAALRDSILSGAVTIFLGNNTGLFTNNIGSYKANIGMANSQSIPSQFAASSSDFSVPIGAWVHNYGSAEAANVTVSAVIDRDGTEIYNEVSSGSNIPVGDSLFFSLSLYSEEGYTPGFYTITYTLSSDDTDGFPDDNLATTNFWINGSGMYSKSRIDPNIGPLGSNGLRPGGTSPPSSFEWCTVMESENASSMQITGVTFSLRTGAESLDGFAAYPRIYEWNDPIGDGTYTDMNELTDNDIYDFTTEEEGEFVTYELGEPIELTDNQRYLVCIGIEADDNNELYIATDQGLDYSTTYESYPEEAFFPLYNGSDWFGGGFGTDNTPAIITNLELVNGIAEDINERDVTPYPNPTVDMINIPFGATLDGTVNLEVYDVAGRSVKSEELCLKNTQALRLDVSDLSSGLHTFNLTFEDNSHTSFRVVITR